MHACVCVCVHVCLCMCMYVHARTCMHVRPFSIKILQVHYGYDREVATMYTCTYMSIASFTCL